MTYRPFHFAHSLVMTLSLLCVLSCGSRSEALGPRFVAVHNVMTTLGLAQTGAINQGSLSEGGEMSAEVSLVGGQCYTFVALGSDSVMDVDVRVVAEDDQELGSDATRDRQAAAQVCPEESGSYRLSVTMTKGSGSYVVSSWSGVVSSGGPSTFSTPAAPQLASGGGSCAAPVALVFGEQVSGTTATGTSTMHGSCAQGAAPEQIYSFTVEERSQISVQVESNFDASLFLLRACGDTSTELGCNDDAGDATHSRVDMALDPGTYFAVVDGYGSSSGNFKIKATATKVQALSAICGAAPTLTVGQKTDGTTEGVPDYFQASCAGNASSPDKVFALDVPTKSRMRLRATTSYDAAMYIRSNCENQSSEMACTDDYLDTNHAVISSLVDPGRYFVYIDGFSGQNRPPSTGTFSVTPELGSPTGGTAPGDTCGNAPPLVNNGELVVDTFAADNTTSGSCGGSDGADVIRQVTIRKRSRISVTLKESEFQGVVYLQKKCGETSSEVVCKAFEPSSPRLVKAAMDFVVTPGTYFLVVDGKVAAGFGLAKFDVKVEDLAELERTCKRAEKLKNGQTKSGNTSGQSDRFHASCANEAKSPDQVYQVVLKKRSRVKVSIDTSFDGALHIRGVCASQSSEIQCNDDDGRNNRRSAIDTVLEKGTYYVVVDGFGDSNSGNYTLTTEITRQ